MGREDYQGAPIEGVTGDVAGSTTSDFGSSQGYVDMGGDEPSVMDTGSAGGIGGFINDSLSSVRDSLSNFFKPTARTDLQEYQDQFGNYKIDPQGNYVYDNPAQFAQRMGSKYMGMDADKSLAENLAYQLTPGGKTPLGILSSLPGAMGVDKAVSGAVSLGNYAAGQIGDRMGDFLTPDVPQARQLGPMPSASIERVDALSQRPNVPNDIEAMQDAVYRQVAGEFAGNLPTARPTEIPADFARDMTPAMPVAMPQEVRDMRVANMATPIAMPQEVRDMRQEVADRRERDAFVDAIMQGVDNYSPKGPAPQVADASEFFTSVFGNMQAPLEFFDNSNLVKKGNVYTSSGTAPRRTRQNQNQGGIFGTGKTLASMIGYGT